MIKITTLKNEMQLKALEIQNFTKSLKILRDGDFFSFHDDKGGSHML